MATFNAYDQPSVIEKSRPIPVQWAGWESDTLTLQHMGWSFSLVGDTDPRYFEQRYHFILHHPDMSLFGVCAEYHFSRERFRTLFDDNVPPLVVNKVSHDFRITNIQAKVDFSVNPRLVDMSPSMIETKEIRSLYDLLPWNLRNINAETKSVVIESKADMEVVDYLQAILDKQQDKQAEIREAKRARERREFAVEERNVKFQVVI